MEAARLKLQARYKDVKTGGKGSIRRKKIPSKKNKHTQESEEVLKVLKLPNTIKDICQEHLTDTQVEECNSYLKAFTSEFCRVISKGHRKSNRPSVDHHTTIRSNLEDYLQIRKHTDGNHMFHENLGNYCVKNLSEQALQQVVKILEICSEIIKDQEYIGYHENTIPTSDSRLKQLYSDLEMDFSVKMFPSSLRSHYKNKLETTEVTNTKKRDTLKNSYFSIIKLLMDEPVGEKEKEISHDENDPLVEELLKEGPDLN